MWFDVVSQPRYEDFNFTYETGNRFQYFGHGMTKREVQHGDLAWYLDKADI